MAEKQQVSMSMDDLQKLLSTILQQQGVQQLEQIKELKKPYVSEKDIENARLAKERFRKSEAQALKFKEWKQKHCTHLRPEDRKSLFYKIRNVFPRGAYSMVCSRCFKTLRNHDPENGVLIDSPEFTHWFAIPSSTIQG